MGAGRLASHCLSAGLVSSCREIFRHFFRAWWSGVFQGVFGKSGAKTWCCCGEFVVECVVQAVVSRSFSRLLKMRNNLNFIFRYFRIRSGFAGRGGNALVRFRWTGRLPESKIPRGQDAQKDVGVFFLKWRDDLECSGVCRSAGDRAWYLGERDNSREIMNDGQRSFRK